MVGESLSEACRCSLLCVVDDLDDILEVHRRETLSTFGTKTSVKKIIIRNDENVPPAGKSEKVCCIAI